MQQSHYKVLGVMSGTSLDGIDMAVITFKYTGSWEYDLQQSETIPYSEDWIDTLKMLVSLSHEELQRIDELYTEYLADSIKRFLTKHQIKDMDFVCSHGHTALHNPDEEITYQIGNLKKLASLINQTVVCDFRIADVKLGGQGAPLVPIGDALLFSKYDFCLNLGGFANISTEINGERIAYDICPVNIVLNHYINKLGFEYDNKGQLAAKGIVNKELLDKLNALSFYSQTYPKSLGLEWVKEVVLPLIDSFKLDVKDILRTFVAHIAHQITNEVNKKQESKILVTGGGVYNSFLITEIKKLTSNTISLPEPKLIEYKEALIFGLLGVLRMRNEINCLSSVTGAKQDHCSGNIYVA